MKLWNTLDEPWRVCLELAWESYSQGSLPIAAVIVDNQGRVIARGRNRLQDDADDGGAPHQVVSGHPLAHAEINALLDFPFNERSPDGCTLLTTTEPCPLCVSALVMSNVRSLVYASRDPWAGCSDMLETVPYLKGKGTRVASLAGLPLESCLVALQSDAHLRLLEARGKSDPQFFGVLRRVLPEGVAAGERLFASGVLSRLARSGATAEQVLGELEKAVSDTT